MTLSKKKLRPATISSPAALRQLHRQMLTAIRNPLTPDYQMRKLALNGRPMATIAAEFIKPNDRLTSGERLEIYNKQYWFRLLDCLADDFPGLRAILGDKQFDALSRAYLDACPSRRYTLHDLGDRLPAFIKAHPEFCGVKSGVPWSRAVRGAMLSPAEKKLAQRHALAIDMARFEWAQILAFDAAHLPALSIDDLLGSNPATLILHLQPHIQLLHLNFPVDDFILAIKKEMVTGAMEAAARRHSATSSAARKIPKPLDLHLAVHRHDLDVYFKRLDPAAFAILRALHQGQPLAAACAKASRAAAPNIQSWFQDWAQLGWFTKNV